MLVLDVERKGASSELESLPKGVDSNNSSVVTIFEFFFRFSI